MKFSKEDFLLIVSEEKTWIYFPATWLIGKNTFKIWKDKSSEGLKITYGGTQGLTYSYINLFFSQKDLEVLLNVVNNERDHNKNRCNALKLFSIS